MWKSWSTLDQPTSMPTPIRKSSVAPTVTTSQRSSWGQSSEAVTVPPVIPAPVPVIPPEETGPVNHSSFYLDDGNFTLLVEDRVIFRVHKSVLTRDPGSAFTSMFALPQMGDVEGQTEENPVILPQVTADEFAELLKVLYALTGLRLRDLAVHSNVYNWPVIFRLADQWSMLSLLADLGSLATEERQMNLLPPIDVMVVGVRHPTLFSQTIRKKMFQAVISLPLSLSIEDGTRLGGSWMAAIAGAREENLSEQLRRSSTSSPFLHGTASASLSTPTDWFAIASNA